MKNKLKFLFVSYAVILFCTCLIIGGTYALFTDSINVTNHLKAGNLDVTLTRTYLEYAVLDEDGYLEVYKNDSWYDFTESVEENVFGIGSKDLYIVPGSYFTAKLDLKNNGNVAFEYSVEIILNSTMNNLANQIIVTITDSENTVSVMKLSDISSGYTFKLGKMNNKNTSESFTIKIEFLDDSNTNLNINNNLAKDQKIEFDLVVEAVQERV